MVVGRCFSATHDAHASIRSMAQCMAMGVAAGVTASLVIKDNKEVRSINFSKIRDGLSKTGAVLEI
jgi:phosphopantetheine adenylyltransferase